jgi:hypothetical protein
MLLPSHLGKRSWAQALSQGFSLGYKGLKQSVFHCLITSTPEGGLKEKRSGINPLGLI